MVRLLSIVARSIPIDILYRYLLLAQNSLDYGTGMKTHVALLLYILDFYQDIARIL
jgi:hypothetical protein